MGDLELFYLNYNSVFSKLPPLDVSIYEEFKNDVGYSAWPEVMDKALLLDPNYTKSDSTLTSLYFILRPNLFDSNEFDTLFSMSFMDFIISQKKIIINRFISDTVLFPDRDTEAFFVKKGFIVNGNLQLKKSLNKDLKLFSDYIVFKYDLKTDIPNFIRYKVADSSKYKFEAIQGDKGYFKANKQIFKELENVFAIYKDRLTMYDEIYFDLGLYPSRIYSSPDSIIEKRKNLSKKHIDMLIEYNTILNID